MLTIGLDVHQCTSTLHILGEPEAHGKSSAPGKPGPPGRRGAKRGPRGRTVTVRGRPDRVVERLRQLDEPFQVVFEASVGYGWLHDELSALPQAERVVVAHPGKMAPICQSKHKNDKNDARTLAKLLLLDDVPGVWVPPIDLRQWRRLIEHRRRLVQSRTRAKNGLRALLRSHNIRPPRGSLWARDGVAWLRGVELPSSTEALQRDQLMMEVEHYNTMIDRVEFELNRIAKDHPGVALLMTIPGVGPRTAEAVVAYIGDPDRFGRTRDVGAYFGLVPCQDESAGKARFGHITKQGPSGVRWLLVEAAWYVRRKCPMMRDHFERISHGKKSRRKIAVVAVARRLACAMAAMLKTGEAWRDGARDADDTTAPDATSNNTAARDKPSPRDADGRPTAA